MDRQPNLNSSAPDDPTESTANGMNSPEPPANPLDPADDPLLEKLLQANSLEQAGDLEGARILYEEIIAIDVSSVWGASAKKALDNLPPESDFDASESPGDLSSLTATGGENAYLNSVASFPPTGKPQGNSTGILGFNWARERWKSLSVGLKFKILLAVAAIVPVVAFERTLVWFERPVAESETAAAPNAISYERVVRARFLGLAVGAGTALALLPIAYAIIRSLELNLRSMVRFTRALSLGNTQAQLSVTTTADEVAVLAEKLQDIADRMGESERQMQIVERERTQDTQKQTQEKERLQQQVMDLLVHIEGARAGDLTIQVPTVAGEVGAIADAFNTTLGSLKQLVERVNTIASRVTQQAQTSQTSVLEFSSATFAQSENLQNTLRTVVGISESIRQVAGTTQEAATIARQATNAAQTGDTAMDRTVEVVDKIRSAVANTAKKAKRLAESSQEVSQILASISGISEKANLLAFNASIEAARAGEQGVGFRQVADEVRALAAQVSESTADIEQLINTIQEETAEVIDVLELGTTEVVKGSGLVDRTKRTLQDLTRLSQQIDGYLQDVSRNTIDQTEASEQVNQTVETAAKIASATATEAQGVAAKLQELATDANTLQSSVAQFQVRSNDR
ncbi:hypothetical protein IQ235_07250 [Oscillatoriales cyanobacterium LEGE 11467]|uniref:Methyl-accepting chemotaxis protein n=1 Tax=Zarconia navalis LEGE 11467 TaxID=1828826 RepID=A0A928VUV9_9CYAN|nr:methyl-accepting chemotaxis protein [Zarconia navalis]MBE9040581.1 hypothetical protein [Zarconia navalis LEGE 11467]